MRNTCMVVFQAPVDPDRSPQSPPHRIWLHQDVLEFLHGRDASVRRLGIVLRQIAARGRPNRIKSCRTPENRGWLRTPMGGGGSGMHFYLWWAPSDSERARITDALGPTPVEVDDIVRHTGLAPSAVYLVLLELDIAGRLHRHPGGLVSIAMMD